MQKQVRTRFAPSPTGFLHIGGLRSALYCYIWAKKYGGSFLLRIEDTDQQRYTEGAVKQIITSLQWAGVTPDEGVIDWKGDQAIEQGEYGPYVQSVRKGLYNKFVQQLLDEGKAYKCWCSSERLEEMRTAQRAAKQMPKYDRHCYYLSDEEKQRNENEGKPFVGRFFVPDIKSVEWNDDVFEHMRFEADQVDDFVILKADGFPTYNFANVVDDHEMQITHVIRGQEFLSSTPKHLLLYQAFGWEVPRMAHMPWILGKNKEKLSKRHGDVAVDEYRRKGFLPQALVNYLALLGWNPGSDQEVFTLDDLVEQFELNDMQKSGAVFDLEKLTWMNGLYIRELKTEELLKQLFPFLERAGLIKREGEEYIDPETDAEISHEKLLAMTALEQERLRTLAEAPEKLAFLLADQPEYETEILVWKKGTPEEAAELLQKVIESWQKREHWDKETIKTSLQSVVEETGKGAGNVFWPTRVALSGKKASPGPEEIAEVIGKEASIKRLKYAIELLAQDQQT